MSVNNGNHVGGVGGGGIGPTNPWHIARAYGVGKVGTDLKGGRVGGGDSVELSGAGAGRAEKIGRLVAAVVPGGIDLREDGTAVVGSGSLAMYGRAADVNAAATGVSVGRVIDVSG